MAQTSPSMTLWSHIAQRFRVCSFVPAPAHQEMSPPPPVPSNQSLSSSPGPTSIDPRSPWSRQSPLIANFIYVLISFGWLSLATPPPGLPPRRIRHHTHQHQHSTPGSFGPNLARYLLSTASAIFAINTINRISPCVSSARVDNSSALIGDTACMQCCSAAECQ